MTPPSPAEAALVAWSCAVGAVSLYASLRALTRATTPTPSPPRSALPVLVVRPCAGAEPSLAETLCSTATLVRGSTARVRFAVAHADDAALPVARAACDALRAEGIDAAVVITHATGLNLKAAQLARVLADSDAAVVLNVDSNVDAGSLSLAAMVDPFADDPRLAALWLPAVETGGSTPGDRASDALLAGSLHAFPVLSALDGAGIVGKVVALRRASLDAVGGFSALEPYLGEDMELARRLRDAGLRVAVAPGVARSLVRGRSVGDVVARYARWITVIRAQRLALMASYPGLFFATPLVLASVGLSAAVEGWSPWLAGCCAVVLVARLLVALCARRASRTPVSRALADVVLADALLAVAFARAALRRDVRWRGRTLALSADGTLRAVA